MLQTRFGMNCYKWLLRNKIIEYWEYWKNRRLTDGVIGDHSSISEW